MVSAPPPGVLGAASLGLAPVDVDADPPPPGKVAVVPRAPGAVVVSPADGVTVVVTPPGVVTAVPPPPRKVEVVGGDSGATGGTCGAGVPMADGGSVLGVVTGLVGGAVSCEGLVESEPPDLPIEVVAAPVKPEPADVAPLPPP